MLTDLTRTLDPRLAQLDQMRTRTRMWDAVIDEQQGRRIRIGPDWLVDWASCNYLGLDLDPDVLATVADHLASWGTHPGWSRMLGSPHQYVEIEERLAELLGAPDTLVLPTISQIHVAVIPMLVAQGTVFVESLAHKTVYDGCVHARGLGATLHRFRSGDLTALAERLRQSAAGPRLVCLDGVNSMTGNLPDLPAYAALCREYGAVLYVDDAHGFGVIGERRPDESSPYGARGNGIVRHLGLDYDELVLVGGFSKAYSSLLAFLTVPTAVKDHLKITAPTYLYSGPSPFASLASVLGGLDVNERRGEEIRARLYRLTRRLLDHVADLGVVTLNTDGTPIVELPISPERDLVDVSAELYRRGLFVTLAPYPGVPKDLVGFRIQVTAAHTDEQLDHLVATLTDLAADGTVRAAVAAATDFSESGGPASPGRSDRLISPP